MFKYSYTTKDKDVYLITWYDSDNKAVCSASYRIVSDSAEELESAIALNAMALKKSNSKRFAEEIEIADEGMMMHMMEETGNE